MNRVLLALAALSLAAVQEEMVENPEHKAWSSQKAGAWVKFKMNMEMGAMKMDGEATWKLKEITAEKAVIEQVNAIEAMGQKQETRTTRTVEARIKKGTDSDGSKVEQTAEGDEELEIKGRKIKCRWVQSKVTGKQGAGVLKIWRTDQIVGGAARMELTSENPKMNTTMTVIDWKAGE